MPSKKHKIGILDSGVGGLVYLWQLSQKPFDMDFVYVCDSENVPYGSRSQAFMQSRVGAMVEALSSQSVDVIVMACNTLTAQTIDLVRKQSDLPIIGIEPFVKHRLMRDQPEDRYGLILTPATYASQRFQTLRASFDPEHLIDVQPLEHLAITIERFPHVCLEDRKNSLIEQLQPLQQKAWTHVILGCTHYSLVSPWIGEILSATIVDPADRVVDHTLTSMEVAGGQPATSFLYSDDCGGAWQETDLSTFHAWPLFSRA